MEDPTGGMWIYLIFLIIPLARILPRMLKKYRNKGLGSGPDDNNKGGFFTDKLIPERPRFREEEPPERPRFRQREPPEPEPQPKPDKKDGWVGKDDF